MPTRATTVTMPRQDLAGSFMETGQEGVLIGTQILTPISVQKDDGVFGRIPLAALLARAEVKRKPKGKYNRSDWDFENDSWLCEERGHEEAFDDRQAANYREVFNYETVLALRGRNIVLREQEIAVRDLLHNTTTFPQSGNTGLAVVNEWDDAPNATPIDDVQAGVNGIKAQCGLIPDTLQIAYRTHRDLCKCEQVLERLKYTGRPFAVLPLDELAGVLGVRRILVPSGPQAMYNNANQGLTESLLDIWTNEYAFLCVTAGGGDIEQTCIGRTFVNDADGGAMTVETYRDDTVRSDIYRVRQVTDEKVIYSACGFLFSNITT